MTDKISNLDNVLEKFDEAYLGLLDESRYWFLQYRRQAVDLIGEVEINIAYSDQSEAEAARMRERALEASENGQSPGIAEMHIKKAVTLVRQGQQSQRKAEHAQMELWDLIHNIRGVPIEVRGLSPTL